MVGRRGRRASRGRRDLSSGRTSHRSTREAGRGNRTDATGITDIARDAGVRQARRARDCVREPWCASSESPPGIAATAIGSETPRTIRRTNRSLRGSIRASREPQGRGVPSRGVVSATRGLDPDLEGSAGGRVVGDDRLDGQPVTAVIYSPLHNHVYRSALVVSNARTVSPEACLASSSASGRRWCGP